MIRSRSAFNEQAAANELRRRSRRLARHATTSSGVEKRPCLRQSRSA
jgi:hypothetical protein